MAANWTTYPGAQPTIISSGGQSAYLDPAEPLAVLDNPSGTRGLAALCIPLLGSGTTLADITGNGGELALFNADMWRFVANRGYEIAVQDTGPRTAKSSADAWKIGDSDSVTIAMAFKMPSSIGDFDGFFGRVLSAAWANGYGAHYESSQVRLWVDNYSLSAQYAALPGSALPAAGAYGLLAARWDRPTKLLALTIYKQGTRSDASKTVTTALTLGTSALEFHAGGIPTGGTCLNAGAIPMIGKWNYFLSDAEINSLIANPFRCITFPTDQVFGPYLNPVTQRWLMGYIPGAPNGVLYTPGNHKTVVSLCGTHLSTDTLLRKMQTEMGTPYDYGNNPGGPAWPEVCDGVPGEEPFAILIPEHWGSGSAPPPANDPAWVGGASYANQSMAIDGFTGALDYADLMQKPCWSTSFALVGITGWSYGLSVAFQAFLNSMRASMFCGRHGKWGGADGGLDFDTEANRLANTRYTWNDGAWPLNTAASAATKPTAQTGTATGAGYDWRAIANKALYIGLYFNGSADPDYASNVAAVANEISILGAAGFQNFAQYLDDTGHWKDRAKAGRFFRQGLAAFQDGPPEGAKYPPPPWREPPRGARGPR